MNGDRGGAPRDGLVRRLDLDRAPDATTLDPRGSVALLVPRAVRDLARGDDETVLVTTSPRNGL